MRKAQHNKIMDNSFEEQTYKPHPIICLRHYIMILIIFAISVFLIVFSEIMWFFIAFIVAIIYLLIAELFRRAHKYIIAKNGVIYEFKLLSKKRSSALYNRIQYIYFSQNIIERILKTGSLHISTSGTKDIEIVFYGIKNPGLVKDMIHDRMRHEAYISSRAAHINSYQKHHKNN